MFQTIPGHGQQGQQQQQDVSNNSWAWTWIHFKVFTERAVWNPTPNSLFWWRNKLDLRENSKKKLDLRLNMDWWYFLQEIKCDVNKYLLLIHKFRKFGRFQWYNGISLKQCEYDIILSTIYLMMTTLTLDKNCKYLQRALFVKWMRIFSLLRLLQHVRAIKDHSKAQVANQSNKRVSIYNWLRKEIFTSELKPSQSSPNSNKLAQLTHLLIQLTHFLTTHATQNNSRNFFNSFYML